MFRATSCLTCFLSFFIIPNQTPINFGSCFHPRPLFFFFYGNVKWKHWTEYWNTIYKQRKYVLLRKNPLSIIFLFQYSDFRLPVGTCTTGWYKCIYFTRHDNAQHNIISFDVSPWMTRNHFFRPFEQNIGTYVIKNNCGVKNK